MDGVGGARCQGNAIEVKGGEAERKGGEARELERKK